MEIAELPGRSMISEVLSGSVELGLGPFQKLISALATIALCTDSRHLVVSLRRLPHHGRRVSGSIAKELGLYHRAGKHLSLSAANFIALCERCWSL